MTAADFRKLALALPGAVESSHMNHPDFRLGGKIFASLGHPDVDHGMVKLTPDQQRAFIELNPSVFKPCTGAWGTRGYTSVRLKGATKSVLVAVFETVVESFLPTGKSGAAAKSKVKAKASARRSVKKSPGPMKKTRKPSAK